VRSFKVSKENFTNRDNNINRYLTEVSRIPLLTPDEEYKIAILAKGGCEKSRRNNVTFVNRSKNEV